MVNNCGRREMQISQLLGSNLIDINKARASIILLRSPLHRDIMISRCSLHSGADKQNVRRLPSKLEGAIVIEDGGMYILSFKLGIGLSRWSLKRKYFAISSRVFTLFQSDGIYANTSSCSLT